MGVSYRNPGFIMESLALLLILFVTSMRTRQNIKNVFTMLGDSKKIKEYNPTEKFHRNFSIENWHMELHRVFMELHKNSP
jgi:flagellar biosynthesis protein FliP